MDTVNFTPESMWNDLISYTTCHIQNVDVCRLNALYQFIHDYLPIDDPGLFPAEVIKSEEIHLTKSRNLWLINQIFLSLSIEKLNSTNNMAMTLLNKILDGSIMKQPWFFYDLVERYLDLLHSLTSVDSRVDTLYVRQFEDNAPLDNAKYSEIILPNKKIKTKIIGIAIELLTHAVRLVDYDKAILRQCADTVIVAVLNENPRMISQGLEFFISYFKSNPQIYENDARYLTILLHTIEFRLINICIYPVKNMGEIVHNWSLLLISFFQHVCSLNFDKAPLPMKEKIMVITFDTLDTYLHSNFTHNVKLVEVIVDVIKKFIDMNPVIVPADYNVQKLMVHFYKWIELATILDYFVLAQVIMPDSNVFSCSVIWKSVIMECKSMLLDNLCTLQVLQKITHLANVVDLKFNIRLQRSTFVQTSALTYFCDKDNFLGEIIKILLKFENIQTIEDFELAIETARNVINTHDCTYINEKLQMELFTYIVFPIIYKQTDKTFLLTYMLTNNMQQNLKDLMTEFENNKSQFEDLQAKSIQLMSDLNYRNFEACNSMTIKKCIKEMIVNPQLRSYNRKINSSFIINIIPLIMNDMISFDEFFQKLMLPYFETLPEEENVYKMLHTLICLMCSETAFVMKYIHKSEILYKCLCIHCEYNDPACFCKIAELPQMSKENRIAAIKKQMDCWVITEANGNFRKIAITSLDKFIHLFTSGKDEVLINMLKVLPAIIKHTGKARDLESINKWSDALTNPNIAVIQTFNEFSKLIWAAINESQVTLTEKEEIGKIIINKLIVATKFCLKHRASDRLFQSTIAQLICKFASFFKPSLDILERCLRLMIFFMMEPSSKIDREASMLTTEMCVQNKVTPIYLLRWYKQNIMQLIVTLAATNFLAHEVLLSKSLDTISKTLGYKEYHVFIVKHYKIILAMLIPFCIKDDACSKLLSVISKILKRDVATTLGNSFLTIFPYLYIYQSADMCNKGIDYIIQHTSTTLYTLLQSDIKQTVAEILIYYHKNPDCVINAFRSLLSKSQDEEVAMSTSQIADYISNRFLGVLNHFEYILLNTNQEFALKRETLLSLGEIIRLLGTNNKVTPFRFKILSVLKTTLDITQPDLKELCFKVFSIFIHSVDVQTLGPLLSNIFLTLECFVPEYEQNVNEILKYLVISNKSLLSHHISDLFFINDTKIAPSIKKEVTKHIHEGPVQQNEDVLMSNLKKFFKYLKSESVSARLYALQYLKKTFKSHSLPDCTFVTKQRNCDPIIDDLVNLLMATCKDADTNLQLKASECLGEMGALEPSFLSTNNDRTNNSISVSVNTDEFVRNALIKLCQAHQSEQNTKIIDNYALGMQEIFLIRRITKTHPLWNSFSENLRQLMEPFLSSCYHGTRNLSSGEFQLVFGISTTRNVMDWAFLWASQWIDHMEDEEGIQTLLSPIKYSIRQNMNVLSFFMPYTLLHFLHASKQDHKDLVYEEFQNIFKSVLNNSADQNKTLPTHHNMKTIHFHSAIIESSKILQDTFDTDPVDLACKCAKLIFSLFDFLENWKILWKKNYTQSRNDKLELVDNFMKKFDKKVMAEVNLKCGEYARALMYIESYIEENKENRLQKELPLLSKIYAELLNTDSLEGIACLRTEEPTLYDSILIHNVLGHYHESAACFERMLQVDELHVDQIKDVVHCYLKLDQPSTAILMAESLMNKFANNEVTQRDVLHLEETKAEPLWRLGRFDDLDKLLENKTIQQNDSWGIRCGMLLSTFRKNNVEQFTNEMNKAYSSVLKMLRNTEVEYCAYQKGYPHIIKLHMLNEFEDVQELTQRKNLQDIKVLDTLFNRWNSRLTLLQPTAYIVEPILCLRRILLTETKKLINQNYTGKNLKEVNEKINDYIGELWIKSTELASKAKMFQQAHLYILNAESYKPKGLFIEKAKLCWEKGYYQNSFQILNGGIQELLKANSVTDFINLNAANRKVFADATFMVATYNAEKQHVSPTLTLASFKDACKACPNVEKNYVAVAVYLERIYNNMKRSEQEGVQGTLKIYNVMQFYGNSLSHGQKCLYQSFPRLLTIWLDFTAKPKTASNHEEILSNMNLFIYKLASNLSTYIWFTAFSQLVSRICHPLKTVTDLLKLILAKVISEFPQQSIWMIQSLHHSQDAARHEHCADIFRHTHLVDMQPLILVFNKITKMLIKLTKVNIQTKNESAWKLSSFAPTLPALLASKEYLPIIIPIQKCMDMNAVSSNFVYIHSIKDNFKMLMSLQKPLRITIVGSDGKEYLCLVKPKDDLRKDFRLMQFNALIKQKLMEDPDARHRRLGIRTYSVLPLNEHCGIIEWISDMSTYRSILYKIYEDLNISVSSRYLKEYTPERGASLEKKRHNFVNFLLPKHKIVFSDWFRKNFTNPHSWYHAKTSYMKTLAVMSIVGYIVGLGDRHGENILLDNANGEVMHVDFDCLFNKGDTLVVPEVVPFRLTQNMVHAMGPLGIEGNFRKCCEITLRVLKENADMLLSVMHTFVYDPLVFIDNSKYGRIDENVDGTGAKAMQNIKTIEERLRGIIKTKMKSIGIPFSTEGQVDYLINEAMHVDNLASMFIGWGAFL